MPLTALPANERAVTGLVIREGLLYGLTTGRAGHLFALDPKSREVRDLHRLSGGVGFSFGAASAGDSIYAGTQRDPTGLGRTPEDGAVGRLLRFRLEGPVARVDDLGAAVPGQGIYALCFSPRSGELAGLTFPDGHFFTRDIAAGSPARDLGAISGHRSFEDDAPRQVARALVVLTDGAVITSGKDGALHRYDPQTRALAALPQRLPCVPGRESWASLEAAAAAPDGGFYGGTSDGYLFRFDARGQVANLGKPLREGGFDGLLLRPSGVLCGVAGERGGMPREFLYDPRGGFTLGGIPRAGGDTCMEGFGAMAADGSGTIYAGELDRIGRIVIYRVDG